MIIIRSDYRYIDREFDRLESLPDAKMNASLDAVLTEGFETARGRVHILTGALKASGKKTSSSNKALSRWQGMFSFGAPNQGVDYAIYEKERDGSHNFFSQVHLLHRRFVSAILRGLKK